MKPFNTIKLYSCGQLYYNASYKLELALAISFVSFGSSQILFLPHFITAAASRFCNRIVLQTDTSAQNIVITTQY